jgi:hypothetical protein
MYLLDLTPRSVLQMNDVSKLFFAPFFRDKIQAEQEPE